MTIWTFSIAHPTTRELIGVAVLCPAARYASVKWKGDRRLDRRFAAGVEWLRVELELTGTSSPAPLAAASNVARLLLHNHEGVVAFMSKIDRYASREQTTPLLDALLTAQAPNQAAS